MKTNEIRSRWWGRSRRGVVVNGLLALAVVSCAGPSTPVASGEPEPAPSVPAQVSVQPQALVFSGTVGAGGTAQSVTLRNPGTAPATITALDVAGPNAGDFAVVGTPPLPWTVPAGTAVSVQVRLRAGTTVGVLQARLQVDGTTSSEVALNGLRAKGLEGENEPPLAQIVQALGFGVNVGTPNLVLGTSAAPVGDEVSVPVFVRAAEGPVTLTPVARYSPDGAVPFGYYQPGSREQTYVTGTLAVGTHQMLAPDLSSGTVAFNPGPGAFGVFLPANGYAAQATYTQDALNTGTTKHGVRVYPLKDAAGVLVAHAYLLAFELGMNGDYQDADFVLQNVQPAQVP